MLAGMDTGEIELNRLVVVEEAPNYPGELIFQPIKGAENLFYSRYPGWVSCYLVLSELYNLPPFVEQLTADGYQVVFGPSCAKIFGDYARWATELVVEGYELYGFQQFSLNRAFEQRYFFFNWATGAGKSLISAVAAKHLFALDAIDVVISCTTTGSKINQARFYEKAGLDVVVNDSSHKPKRTRIYGEAHQVYVMNYEKMWADRTQLSALTRGRRVVWIFDEVSKIVTGENKPNRARRAFEHMNLDTHPDSKIWPMSASVVNGNPQRFRDAFSLGDYAHDRPLGTSAQFTARYAEKVETYQLETANNKRFEVTNITWNQFKLQEIRHRVGSRTQTARKTDPGIAHLFKELQTLVEPIQVSAGERKIIEAIVDKAAEAREVGQTLKPFYDLLRYTLNTPLALRHTNHEAGKQLAVDFGDTLDTLASSKVTRLNEMLTALREEGDQCLVFTHWTSLTLHLIKDLIEVPLVAHYGTGQSATDRQAAQDNFKANPDLTCFLTSDAGKEGLNMQNARVVIQLDPTYSYDDTYQRASRIHRADSHLDGLTNYVFLAEGTVDERVWRTNLAGRLISEAAQGTTESLNFAADLTWADRERAQRGEAQSLAWLIFGNQ